VSRITSGATATLDLSKHLRPAKPLQVTDVTDPRAFGCGFAALCCIAELLKGGSEICLGAVPGLLGRREEADSGGCD